MNLSILPGNLIQAAVVYWGGRALFEASKLLGILFYTVNKGRRPA